MRSWLASILVFLVCAPLLAQTAKPKTSTTTTTTTTTTPQATPKKRAAAPKPKAAAKPTKASELKTLQDAVSTQQQQIQMLRDELQKRDAAVQQMQQQINQLQSATQQAQSTATEAEGCCKTNQEGLGTLKTNLGTVQSTATATATSLAADEKRIAALESPAAIKYKGITITPGGFISANAIYRSKAQNLSNASSFAGMPFSGQPLSHLSELRLTSRYSRLSVLGQGKFGGNNVQAYYEMDFEGAAQTANENITNSFTPRVREAWVNVDTASGWSFAGGQTWSLITANRTGVGPRGLMLPGHIDASLVVGFHYAREGTFRVYKSFNKKTFIAFAIENPETVSTAIPTQGAGCTPPVAAGSRCLFGLQGSPGQPSATAPNGGFAAATSVDKLPDFVGKVAFEGKWGHLEVGAIGRFYRVRISNGALINVPNAGTNDTNAAAAATVNAVFPLVPKKVDLVLATLFGQGVGRFGPGGGTDVTFKLDGSLEPIRGFQGYAGLEVHPNPKWDLLLYYGNEYYARTQYNTGGNVAGTTLPNAFGYGVISADLRGCRFEFPSGFGCSASTRDIYEITPGFWYRFYKGPAGTIQYGMFWEYTHRGLWAGRVGTTTATASLTGSFPGIQNTVFSSFRWYFP